MASESACAGVNFFLNLFQKSSQSKNFGQPSFSESSFHLKIRAVHFSACPDFIYIGHGPYYFCLLITELFGTETDVGLTGVKKGQTFFTISVKLWRGHRFGSSGFPGCRLRVGRGVRYDRRWGDGSCWEPGYSVKDLV